MADLRVPTGDEAEERIEAAKAILDEYATMAIAMTHEGEPWVAKAFFVEDEPDSGRFDMCCSLLLGAHKIAMIRENPRIAFVVAGDEPDRWLQGAGRLELVADEADASAIAKRLEEKSPAAGQFLRRADCSAARIHVARMQFTDLRRTPPITEFTFG